MRKILQEIDSEHLQIETTECEGLWSDAVGCRFFDSSDVK